MRYIADYFYKHQISRIAMLSFLEWLADHNIESASFKSVEDVEMEYLNSCRI